ncbi:MAG: class I SAM-dependent methyltransferase [bacterium]|nr:class I SAM-dependent methyltransferase [bacterium]
MSKAGEQGFLAKTGDAGRAHSLSKPFSDADCGYNLASMGAIMALLPPPPARLLDLGCGGGWTSIFLARRGYDVTGQDIAADMVDLARDNQAIQGVEGGLQFLCSDFEALGMDDQFDAALFFDSLHHAEDERLAIESAYRALKPGGILITHEPGEGHSQSPESIEAMAHYGVSERDMPPHLIVRRGLEVGFRSYRVLPMPIHLFSVFYKDRGPLPRFGKQRWLLIRRAWRMLFEPDMALGSIVVMTK